MHQNDRLLTIWIYVVGFGLSILGMAAYVLDWPLIIQLATFPLMIVLLRGTELAVRRARRRR